MTTATGENPQGYVWQALQYRYLNALLGQSASMGISINASGKVAGQSCLSGGVQCNGVLWNGDAPLYLGNFAPVFLTDGGDIYGNIAGGQGTAATWHDGALTALNIAGNCYNCDGSVAIGANNHGQVVGQYIQDVNGDGSYYAPGGALWQNGVFTDMGLNATPLGINDKSQIVGHMFIQTVGDVAGEWNHLKFSQLPSLQTSYIGDYAALAINNSGVVVGHSLNDDGAVRAVKWDASGVTDLNTKIHGKIPSTVTATNAIAIDDVGQILVEATDSTNGEISTYLLTPSTELLPTAVPQFSHTPRTYASAQHVAISDSTAHSIIHYTLDGTTPTTASAVYSQQLTIASTTTIKAIASGADSHAISEVGSATFTIAAPAGPAVVGGLGSTATLFAVRDVFLNARGTGVDGAGNALATDELGTSLNWGATEFDLAGPHVASGTTGATIRLTSGHFASVKLLAVGVGGDHLDEPFTVSYTDGSTELVQQSISDWYSPQFHQGEAIALTMAHRVTPTGTFSYGPFYLYGYTLPANPTKVIESITTPADPHVVVLSAASANPQGKERPVDLYNEFNVIGAIDDGHAIVGGGLDSHDDAYSASLLGTALSWSGNLFELGSAGVPNAVSRATIALPAGSFSKLKVLATAVNGNAPGEHFKVTYADGTSQQFTQSISDWHITQAYSGEAIASSMAYRLDSSGSPHAGPYHLYGFSFEIDPKRTVKSVELPGSSNVVTFAMTLVP